MSFRNLLLVTCGLVAAHGAAAQPSRNPDVVAAHTDGHPAVGKASAATPRPSETSAAAPIKVTPAGTIEGSDTFSIPLSDYLSPAAKANYAEFLNHQFPVAKDIQTYRTLLDEYLLPTLNKWKALYPVDVELAKIGGVTVDIITPKAGVQEKNRNRVLILLHGGAFMVGEGLGGQNEAVPIAGVGGIKVVSVRYRQGPEHRFPAASEDVAAVYGALLKQYRPENIAIEGCSAGGILTGEAMVWFQQHKLPRPGAIGIFCAGLDFARRGDAHIISNLLNGKPSAAPALPQMPYFAGADLSDPLISPAYSPEALAKFPPTLFLTGTRDQLMSDAMAGHAKLLKAGAESHLYVIEGWGHGTVWGAPGVPESTDALNVIWKFFDTHLGKQPK